MYIRIYNSPLIPFLLSYYWPPIFNHYFPICPSVSRILTRYYTRHMWPQATCAPGFLKLLWLTHRYVACVSVCLPPRPLIASHGKYTRNNLIMKFYGYSILYMTLPSINWIGMAFVTLWDVNACQRRVK